MKVKSTFFVMPLMVAGLLAAVVDPPVHEIKYPVAYVLGVAVQVTVAVEVGPPPPGPPRWQLAPTLLGGWSVDDEYVAEADAAVEKLAWATCPVQPTITTIGTRTRRNERKRRSRARDPRGCRRGCLSRWSLAVTSLNSGLGVRGCIGLPSGLL